MCVDRTTKLLLLIIGLGLWAVAFAQFLSPGPAQAADTMKVDVNIAEIGGQSISSGHGMPIEGTWSSSYPLLIKEVE